MCPKEIFGMLEHPPWTRKFEERKDRTRTDDGREDKCADETTALLVEEINKLDALRAERSAFM